MFSQVLDTLLEELAGVGMDGAKDKGNHDFPDKWKTPFTRFLTTAEFKFCLSASYSSVYWVKIQPANKHRLIQDTSGSSIFHSLACVGPNKIHMKTQIL